MAVGSGLVKLLAASCPFWCECPVIWAETRIVFASLVYYPRFTPNPLGLGREARKFGLQAVCYAVKIEAFNVCVKCVLCHESLIG